MMAYLDRMIRIRPRPIELTFRACRFPEYPGMSGILETTGQLELAQVERLRAMDLANLVDGQIVKIEH